MSDIWPKWTVFSEWKYHLVNLAFDFDGETFYGFAFFEQISVVTRWLLCCEFSITFQMFAVYMANCLLIDFLI